MGNRSLDEYRKMCNNQPMESTVLFKTTECNGCGEVLSCTGPYCDAANDELWLCQDCLEDTGHAAD